MNKNLLILVGLACVLLSAGCEKPFYTVAPVVELGLIANQDESSKEAEQN